MEEDSAVSWQFFSSPKIEVIDPLTVKFTLDHPNVAFPNYLTLWGMSILSKAYADANGVEALSDKPLGSGPFCLDTWNKGQEIILKPNPGYWADDGPFVDEVHIKVVQDDNARVLQVQTGEVDIALDVPYAQVEALKSVPGVEVGVDTLYGTAAIPLNQKTVPQFADQKVRQAMAYAIDRQALVDAVLLGQGEVAKSPFYGPNILYWTGDYEIPFDLDKAKQLMAESSAPDGFAAELLIPSGDSMAQQTAVILKDQLAKHQHRHHHHPGRVGHVVGDVVGRHLPDALQAGHERRDRPGREHAVRLLVDGRGRFGCGLHRLSQRPHRRAEQAGRGRVRHDQARRAVPRAAADRDGRSAAAVALPSVEPVGDAGQHRRLLGLPDRPAPLLAGVEGGELGKGTRSGASGAQASADVASEPSSSAPERCRRGRLRSKGFGLRAHWRKYTFQEPAM